MSRMAQEEDDMFSTAEKAAILRSVAIFAATPEQTLVEVATLLEPRSVSATETIVRKGEPGDCMYIVADGKVRVHDGDLILNFLGPGSVFGEMALLDAEPRMASVTAEQDTYLFRVGQEAFYDLLARRAEIS